MKKRKIFLRFVAMAALSVTITAHAQTTAFTYQGKLDDGCCPATGLYDFVFKVYDSPDPATLPNTQVGVTFATNGVPVTNGLFTVSLDFDSPGSTVSSVFAGARRWLQIDVRTNNAMPPASFVPLTPRTELAPTPYALYAKSAGTVANGAITPAMVNSSGASAGQSLIFNGSSVGWGSGGSSIWSLNGANAYYNGGNVGIGTANPQELLQVGSDSIRGVVRVQGSTSRAPLVQLSDVQAGGREWNIYSGGAAPGYFSVADVTAHRLVIDTSGNVGIGTTTPTDTLDVNGGFRVMGASTATTGSGVEIDYNVVGPRIFAFNRDTSAFQDFGIGDFPRGKGVLITAGGNVGIGTTAPEAKLHAVLTGDGQAVRGIHPASGVYGELATVSQPGEFPFRAAVYGYGPNDYAGYFVGNVHVNVNSSGSAFYARNDYATFDSTAVEGSSRSGTGVSGTGPVVGVYGSSSRYGVQAVNNSGTSALLATPTFAGEFFGNVSVHGNLSKSGGSFKIDHPLDPANKYLYHSFVESPDMKNIYDGVTSLDSNGEVIVELPNWCESLNNNFRYQLTPIGAAAPNLHVAEKVSGNHFKIAGGNAGQEISWQVTGIRQDAYANAHRIPVEEDKPGEERGRYLYPELFGQSKEKSVNGVLHPNMKQGSHRPAEKNVHP